MKQKLITLNLNDKDFKYIKNLKKELYYRSNDPSFNIFDDLIILGSTNLTSFNNLNLKIKSPYIEFETKISISKNTTFIKSINNEFINNLKAQLKINNVDNFNFDFFKLDLKKSDLPIIYLGNKFNTNIKVNKLIISDIRLNIIEIEIDNNMFKYNKIATIHLSSNKYH